MSQQEAKRAKDPRQILLLQEKISYDDYNLACIVVFPPFRQRGWATLLIEFSESCDDLTSPTFHV